MVEAHEEDALDLDARQLCPDGACTGVIGDDGRCRECGRSAEGAASEGAASASAEVEAAASADPVSDFDDRQLCPDGACTGLIGSDGKCRACGRAAAS
jgi:hypothetical protein